MEVPTRFQGTLGPPPSEMELTLRLYPANKNRETLLIDHCSVSWAQDENIPLGWRVPQAVR